MRLATLFLLTVSLHAEPMTFNFSGTWQNVIRDIDIVGGEIQQGDPITGSFTFERLGDNSVQGELSFQLGALAFDPFYFVEYPEGWGQMAVVTPDLACSTWLGDAHCLVVLSFTGPQNTGCGGDGTGCHSLSLWGSNLTEWSVGLASSRNIVISPFLPFVVAEQYFIPEPPTILLVSAGLLALLWRRHRLVRVRFRVTTFPDLSRDARG
jgi:hypothetical protein